MKEKLEEMLQKHGYVPKYQVDVIGRAVDIPVMYADASALMLLFPAPAERVGRFLRSGRLVPIGIMNGECLLAITIFDYRKSPVGPYKEFTFSVPVLLDAKVRVPLLPIVFESLFKKSGHCVIQIGADNDTARAHIREIFPYPLFDRNLSINLADDSTVVRARIAAHGQEIFSTEHPLFPDSKYRIAKRCYNTYFTDRGQVYNVRLTTFSYSARGIFPRDARVTVGNGNHTLIEILREIGIRQRPLFSLYYKNAVEIAEAPVPV